MNDELRPRAALALAESFDDVVVPHLDAAYRLARWLMRNEHDAEDVVQEASLRALRYFRTFGGGDGRAWFLRIVRNICSDWRGGRPASATDEFDEQRHGDARPASDPETLLLQTDDTDLVARAMRSLPDRLHQVLVLRELHGLTYRELADATGLPIGTVMSRLSRAREALRGAVHNELKPSGARTLVRDEEAAAVSAGEAPVARNIPAARRVRTGRKGRNLWNSRQSDRDSRIGVHCS
jgi:RNA polymerase sigma-70 factor, ECF subfamily